MSLVRCRIERRYVAGERHNEKAPRRDWELRDPLAKGRFDLDVRQRSQTLTLMLKICQF
jgi:hypothetical protein